MALQRLTVFLGSDINTPIREYSMATLSSDDMRKVASSGEYAGTQRPDIFAKKINDKKSFRISTANGKEIFGIEYNKTTETLTYYVKGDSKNINTIKRSQIFKDKDFGGGSGSGGGAEDTKYTESLQCYYCSYVFNYATSHPCKSVSDAQLKNAETYAHTDVKLADCLSKGPASWVKDDVYLKTANKLYEKFGNRITGKAHFHRGSRFMKNVYAAYKACKAKDAASGNQQAPGSFSDDKWNPGDIWMSTLGVEATPFANFTDSWGELNGKVLELAGGGVNATGKISVLGISLKKIPSTQVTAKLQEFSTPEQMAARKSYTWGKWSWGKTGKFFDSQDIYVTISGKEVQFRTFGGDTSWQGEIKGQAAAGGKIGGGNVNFYTKKIFKEDVFNGKTGRTAENQFLSEITRDQKKLDMLLYEGYKRHNANSSPKVTEIPKQEFLATCSEQDSNFKNSKILCINFLDAVYAGTEQDRNKFATELFRYASSDTDQSSYFVKLY